MSRGQVTQRRGPKVRTGGGKGYAAIEWVAWIFILVAVGRIAEVIPILSIIPLAKVTLLAWVIMIAKSDKLKQGHLLKVPMARNALWLFGWATCSILFSIWFVSSVKFVAINGFLILIAYTLICKSVEGWPQLRRLLASLVVSAELLSVMTLLSYTGGRAAIGSMYDTNDLAYMLVTMMPISIAFIATSSGLWRIRYLGGLSVVLVATLLTQSRGGLLGLGGAMVFFIFQPVPLFNKKASLQGTFGGALSRLLIIGVVAMAAWTVLPSETKARFQTMNDLGSDYNTDESNAHSRSSIWKRNLAAVATRPIGFGVSSFPAVDIRNGGVFMTAHNSLVLITVELGIVGLIIYLRMYYLAWRAMATIQKNQDASDEDREKKIFSRAIQACLTGNFISGFFLSMSYSYVLWMLMAAATAFAIVVGGAADGPLNNTGTTIKRRSRLARSRGLTV